MLLGRKHTGAHTPTHTSGVMKDAHHKDIPNHLCALMIRCPLLKHFRNKRYTRLVLEFRPHNVQVLSQAVFKACVQQLAVPMQHQGVRCPIQFLEGKMRCILFVDVLHSCFELGPGFSCLILCHVHAAPHVGSTKDLHPGEAP